MADGAFGFTLDGLRGGPLPLAPLAGRPLLLVNTASRCGFTPQYAGLQRLWTEYRERGLTVVGVPSNDFGGQEPGSSEQIAGFCQVNYGVDFPLAAKAHVRGPERHPLFAWLAEQGGALAAPRWNFYKYLIAPDGRLGTWFSSVTPPASGRVRRAVERLLG